MKSTNTLRKKSSLSVEKNFDWQEASQQGSMMFGKQAPSDIKIEQAVLGAIILVTGAIDKVKDTLSEESFYKVEHQILYRTILDMEDKGKSIDMLTVAQYMSKKQMEKIGGAHYLAELTGKVASDANIEHHAHILEQLHISRQHIKLSYQLNKYAFEQTQDVFQVQEWLEKEAAEITMTQKWRHKELLQNIQKEREKTNNPYPIKVFPERIRNIMEEYAYCNRFPISFVGSSILAVVSSAMGNAVRMQYSTTYKTAVSVFMALVGAPGMAKTWTIKEMARPLFDRDAELEEMFDHEMATWTEEKRDHDDAQANMKDKEPYSEPEPEMRQLVVEDFTMESLIGVFETNKKGVFGWQDELIALFNSLNAYRSGGSDGQKLLKIFDGNPFKINRSGKKPISVKNTFMSVVGGIQPSRLRDMASGGRIGDGTLGRFCFDYPDDQNIPDPNRDTVRDDYIEDYQVIINYILNLPNYYDDLGSERLMKPINIRFSQAAKIAYFEWETLNNKLVNESEDHIRTVHKKLENQCLRFALLMQMIEWACEDRPFRNILELEMSEIGVPALQAAFELIEYYRHCSLRVLDKLESPLAKLKPELRAIYDQLPDIFQSKELIELAKAAGIGAMTARRKILRDKDLVKQLNGKSGMYQKNMQG
ncbi:MAG: DUF3987 domain-containing protein [Bacteroidota bacterium]